VQQLQVVGGQAGVDVWAPYEGNGVGDPIQADVQVSSRRGAWVMTSWSSTRPVAWASMQT